MTISDLMTATEGQTFDRKSVKIAAKDLATTVVAFANAITHRDYSILGTDIQIKMFDDRISVESPGHLPSIVRLDNMRNVHFSRNPQIAQFLKAHKYVRKFGEGVDRMYRELAEAGNPAPKYEQVAFLIIGTVYSILHGEIQDKNNPTENPTENLISLEEKIIETLRSNPSFTQKQLAEELAIGYTTIREYITKLRKKGAISRIGPDKGGYWQVNDIEKA